MRSTASTVVGLALATLVPPPAAARPDTGPDAGPPAVVIVSIDALRADRLSAYGYRRPTSPAIDRLAAGGARFTAARTVEPLTAPALISAFTGLPPHRHGASRNGLQMRDGLASLPGELAARGWATAAVVSNWTLKDDITHLGALFDDYLEVFTRKRWFGLVNSEATAVDVTDAALAWLERRLATGGGEPLLLWVHYVEPHAPYRFHAEEAARLGIARGAASKSDRYDTEVAAADREVDRLLTEVRRRLPRPEPIVVLLADHGESLGEHDYWGHGRHLFEPSLHIPLIVSWPGHVAPATIDAQASILDLAPTVLGLLGTPSQLEVPGHDWAPRLLAGGAPAPATPPRALCYQAHKGAVQVRHDSQRARSRGLLEVGVVEGPRKEVFDVRDNAVRVYDLAADPREVHPAPPAGGTPSAALMSCLGTITDGLGALDRLAAKRLDDDSVAQLRALGYLE